MAICSRLHQFFAFPGSGGCAWDLEWETAPHYVSESQNCQSLSFVKHLADKTTYLRNYFAALANVSLQPFQVYVSTLLVPPQESFRLQNLSFLPI